MNLPVKSAPANHKIPERRAMVLRFCQDEVAAGRPFPTALRIAVYMGWESSTSAMDALSRLAFYDKAIRCIYTSRKRTFDLLEVP